LKNSDSRSDPLLNLDSPQSFSLPQVKAAFGHDVDVCQVAVLGGRAPKAFWLRSAVTGKVVWAVDRGAEACRAAGIFPARALGDFDSIGEEGGAWLERLGVKTERYPADKDYTDFQLCLQQMKGDLLVTGCWGGRFDHAFANVFSILWGREWGANVRAFADESEVLIPLAGEASVDLLFREPPSVLSLLPLSDVCEGIALRGAKWELNGAEISLGRPYTVSNVPTGNRVSVRLQKGSLGIYCLFGEVKP
jgi:thiamine pyrophosphokinase